MKKHIPLIILIFMVSALPARLLIGYLSSYEFLQKQRTELAKAKSGDIEIALICNKAFSGTDFKKGADLAAEEENEKGFFFSKDNIKFQKKMILHSYHDDKINNDYLTSQIINNKHIVAAISLQESTEAIKSSVSFEKYGIVMLSTAASDEHLTNHEFKYTFSTIPTSKSYTLSLVDFANTKKYKQIACLYSREGIGGFILIRNFISSLINTDISVIFSHSITSKKEDYRELIYDMQKKPFDAIVLGVKGDAAARIIKQMRSMGVNQPILSGISLDDTTLWNKSNQTANNIFVASIFDDTENNKDFTHYKDKLGKNASFSAFQGYNAVKVLAAAIRKGESYNPIDIAGALKFNLKNDIGNSYFTEEGLVAKNTIFIKEMKNGKFYMPLN